MGLVQTAMIIDDDTDLSTLLAKLLKKRKILSMEIDNLEDAENYLGYLKPTVIFLDNSFPQGLGVNFIHKIKSADKDIKIIMLTADIDDWIEKKATEEGADYFLHKPVTADVINNVLDELNIKR